MRVEAKNSKYTLFIYFRYKSKEKKYKISSVLSYNKVKELNSSSLFISNLSLFKFLPFFITLYLYINSYISEWLTKTHRSNYWT